MIWLPPVSLVWFLLVGAVAVYYLQAYRFRLRLRRLGGVQAPVIREALPFGLGLAYRSYLATKAFQLIPFVEENMVRSGQGSPPSYDEHRNEKEPPVASAKNRTCEGTVFGVRRLIFTDDPENIKALLATKFSDFGKGSRFYQEWFEFLGDSIFATDGAQWHASRQLIRPQFLKERLADLACFEAHIPDLLRAIVYGGPLPHEHYPVSLSSTTTTTDPRPLDISNLFFRYTLDVTTSFLLGSQVRSLCQTKNKFAEAFDEVQRVQSLLVRTPVFNFLLDRTSYRRGLAVINDFVHEHVDRALQLTPDELAQASASPTSSGYTFLHALVHFSRDRKVLRDQIVSILLAGRDTTACTLSWAVYELAQHPDKVARLRHEIVSVVGPDPDTPPTYEDLRAMPYLKAIVNETLRLYPAVPFNSRTALHDTCLPRGGGPDGAQPVAVTQGTQVVYGPIMLHRRQDLYPPGSPPAAEFHPERWATWHPTGYEYLPFNAGPRICVGQKFALTEVSYVLCRIFQRYASVRSHMDDGGRPRMRMEVVVRPRDGVHVSFTPATPTDAGLADKGNA